MKSPVGDKSRFRRFKCGICEELMEEVDPVRERCQAAFSRAYGPPVER
jgi:hypothetical protein